MLCIKLKKHQVVSIVMTEIDSYYLRRFKCEDIDISHDRNFIVELTEREWKIEFCQCEKCIERRLSIEEVA